MDDTIQTAIKAKSLNESSAKTANADYATIVIGGGITGCAAAYYLAKSGREVALIEEFDLNTQASGRNAGSLHGQIQHHPFVERGEEWARAFLPALSFLADSVELWRGLEAELGTDLEVTTGGGILVAETTGQMRDIERKVNLERAAGYPSELIGRDDLARIAPYISDSMMGAEFSPSEGVANPLLATPALAKAATHHGAAIHIHTRVLSIDSEPAGYHVITTKGSMRCRDLVIAAGSETSRLGSILGKNLPVQDEAIQLSVTEPVEQFVPHLVYFAGDALTFKQSKTGTLLIGGGWPAYQPEPGGSVRVDARSLQENLKVAQTVVPSVGRVRVVRTWAGIARRTPDLMPIIGKVSDRGQVVVGLFPHMGFTAGPLLGKTLSDLVLGRRSDRDLSPFSPDRF